MTLTILLVAINIVVFIWQLSTGGPDVDHGFLYGPLIMQGQWWRLVSGAFEHGSIPHVALNMFALYQVGTIVETLFGKVRFLLLYAIAILGSGLAVVYFNFATPTLGASGAIFGLFGALVAVGIRLGKRGRGLIAQVLPVIGLNLVFTFAVPGISIAAHVGGLITGFIAGLVLFMVPSRQRDDAFAYAFAPPADSDGIETIEHPALVPVHEGAHDDQEGAPVLRDPRE